MSTGTVKFYNASKGFGFITAEDGKDIFFHISEVQEAEPKNGDQVEFQMGESKKGPCAVQIKVKK